MENLRATHPLAVSGLSTSSSLTSTAIDPSELPEGFSAVDPNQPFNAQQEQQAAVAASQQQQQAQQNQAILRQALLPEALERLQRIKLVKPEKAKKVESLIVSMAMKGRLTSPMNEGKLIELLEDQVAAVGSKISTPSNGNRRVGGACSNSGIQIQRKRYNFDDDDDDDDDDDLL